MKGDIALAGFMWSADDWHALDAAARAELIAAAGSAPRDDGWVVTPLTGLLSGPHAVANDDR